MKTIKLSIEQLQRGFRPREFRPDAVYQFLFTDLLRLGADDVACELTADDIELEDDDDEEEEADPVICPCINILIAAKSPSSDGKGQENSFWGGGAWNSPKNRLRASKTKDNFQKLMRDALTLAGFAECCLNVQEVDLSAAKYKPFFFKNSYGDITEMLDLDAKTDQLPEMIRKDLGKKAPLKCFTILIVRLFTKPSAGFGKTPTGGTTICDPVPGTDPKVWTMKSVNFSIIPEAAQAWAIAHEILHQGGVTHSKSNLLYPGGDGLPDPAVVPKSQERDEDDLMRPTPKATAKATSADLKKLKDYAMANKCCDIGNPEGSCIK
jgi:hypothetical protein